VVVVAALCFGWFGTDVGGVLMWRTSATRSRCSCVVVVSLGMVVVDEVGVAVLAGVGSEVVVETWRMFTARSVDCDGGIVSVYCSSSEARNFAMAFRTRSGNGPDRFCAQCSSMRVSCVSIFLTVFKSSSVSAGNAAGFLLVTAREVVVVVVVPILLAIGLVVAHLSRARAFLVAFFQILSIFVKWKAEN